MTDGPDDLAIFDHGDEVTSTRPRLLQVLGALVVAGLLVGAVVAIVVGGIASIRPVAGGSGSAVCAGESSCDGLSVAQLRDLTGIPFADDATVIDSRYEHTDAAITVTATVALANGSANPLDSANYSPVGRAGVEWPSDLTVLGYYAAMGEQGALYAEAVHAERAGSELVLVRVERLL